MKLMTAPWAAWVLTSLAVLSTCSAKGGWNQCRSFMASKKITAERWPSSLTVSPEDRPPWEMHVMTSSSCLNSFYDMHLLSNGFSILAKTTTCFPPGFGLSAFLKQQVEAGLAKAACPSASHRMYEGIFAWVPEWLTAKKASWVDE